MTYIYIYACERLGHTLDWELAGEEAADQVDILNKGKTRWALSEEFEEWTPIEPSKGFRVRIRYLFDNERGNWQEMMVGIFELDPGIHYTLHYHNHPEIYYIISGHGVIYVGDSKIGVSSGSTIYVRARVVHGADCLGKEPLRMYWVYGAEIIGQNKNWTPVEDIYTEVRVR